MKRARAPAPAPAPLLRDAPADPSEHDYLIDGFMRKHPMLSLESCSSESLKLIHDAQNRLSVEPAEWEKTTKTHDDGYLRRAQQTIGERPCALESDCLALFLARMRYGPDNDRGFVCREYLLPSEEAAFRDGRGLPETRKKCLLCTRYFASFVYTIARVDPTYRAGKPLEDLPVADGAPDARLRAADGAPRAASSVGETGGYHPAAVLGWDEAIDANADCGVLPMLLNPTVRFCSSHYAYVQNGEGQYEIVQQNVGVDERVTNPFRRPPPRARAAVAADMPSLEPRQST